MGSNKKSMSLMQLGTNEGRPTWNHGNRGELQTGEHGSTGSSRASPRTATHGAAPSTRSRVSRSRQSQTLDTRRKRFTKLNMTLKPRAGGSASSTKTKTKSDGKRPQRRSEKESVLLVAQEIKFARALAGNEKKSRDRVLKTLHKWVAQRCSQDYDFKEEDFMRIWKGLFYAVWMSDKPLIQEELCESIASILDAFPAGSGRPAALFFKCALRSLATEWYGIDQHRMDKFLMLVRRLLRAAFRGVRRDAWAAESCARLAAALAAPGELLAPETPPYARNALALQIHLVDCYAEELAKVSEGSLPAEALVELVRPLARCMALHAEPRLCGSIKRNVLVHLLRQSPLGQEYEEKRRVWTQMGCPVGGVDSLEKIPVSDAEDSAASDDETSGEARAPALDPRAGRVDVVLPTLPVPGAQLAAMLAPLAADRRATTANRRRVRVCMQHFQDLESGRYPLRAREDIVPPGAPELRMPRPARAARRLHHLEKRLDAQSDELALRGLSRKHRKRVLAKSRERLSGGAAEGVDGAAGGDDASLPPPGRKAKRARRRSDAGAASGEWQIEEATPSSDGNSVDSEEKKEENPKQDKRSRNKRKLSTTLQDEVPLKKLRNLLKDKEVNGNSARSKKTPKVSDDASAAKADMSPKSATKCKELEKAKVNKSRENIPKIAKPRVIAKKLGSPTSKTTRTQPEKVKNFQKKTEETSSNKEVKGKLRGKSAEKRGETVETQVNGDVDSKIRVTPKKVTIVLKNNTIQGAVDYYKSVRKSPSIPFDSSKKPSKTNLKPNSLPSPIHPFFNKKLRLRM